VISDYETPEGNTLSRHFIPGCLSKQVDYIKEFRPLSIGMSNIVKHLEAAAVRVDPSLSIQQAKEQLIANLDDYLINRILSPDTLITKRVAAEVKDGDVILTYANSSLVSKSLIEAHHLERQFRVIIVDSNPLYEGRILAANLLDAGLQSEYYTLSNISYAISQATKVLVGTQGILNDGRLYARAGTAVVAMHANSNDVPVIVCSQSFKFSDEASVDAFARNELAPLEDFLDDEDLQKKWTEKSKALPLLRIVNPLYDLTPTKFVSVVACEFGCLTVEKVPEIYALVDQSQNSQDI
jgi:translation initiation factor eIF-2B subunit delta